MVIYNFELIKNIKQFPHGGLFMKLKINMSDQNETVKNYIKAQELLNKKNSVGFLKHIVFLFNFNQKLSLYKLR